MSDEANLVRPTARELLEAARAGGPVPILVVRWGTGPIVDVSVQRACTCCGEKVAVTPSSLDFAKRITGSAADPPLVCDVCLSAVRS